MDEFIKLLDPGLDYVSHEITGDTIVITVISNKEEVVCPYCGHPSSKKHSVYERSFQDLPVMGMKSKIIFLTERCSVQTRGAATPHLQKHSHS